MYSVYLKRSRWAIYKATVKSKSLVFNKRVFQSFNVNKIIMIVM